MNVASQSNPSTCPGAQPQDDGDPERRRPGWNWRNCWPKPGQGWRGATRIPVAAGIAALRQAVEGSVPARNGQGQVTPDG